jgi:hypothetical protein
VVSGGIVLVVSAGTREVSGADIVVSALVLSELPDTFFVELHAEIAMVSVPATARLRINFLIGICFVFKNNEAMQIRN